VLGWGHSRAGTEDGWWMTDDTAMGSIGHGIWLPGSISNRIVEEKRSRST
jgi:hypothetical protein